MTHHLRSCSLCWAATAWHLCLQRIDGSCQVGNPENIHQKIEFNVRRVTMPCLGVLIDLLCVAGALRAKGGGYQLGRIPRRTHPYIPNHHHSSI